MGNERKIDNKKTELSLSAIMFFSPLIQNILKNNKNLSKNLNNQDKEFIKGFIKLGYFNIFLLIISITLQIIFYLTKISNLQTINTVIISILAGSLVIGSIYAISDKNISKKNTNLHQNSNNSIVSKGQNYYIPINKFRLLIDYIPLYNIYLRYKNHNFDTPDIILKESILTWGIISIILVIFSNTTINYIILAIIIVRIVALINGVDIPQTIQKKINKLFVKNPEELRGYIKGNIINLFNKISLSENIQSQKKEYELLFKNTNKQIIFEFFILIFLGIFGLYKGIIKQNISSIIGITFIITRYIIMLAKRHHTPHIPILKEITSIFFKYKK